LFILTTIKGEMFMTSVEQEVCAGIDWGTALHRVCMVDASGQVVGEKTFEQSVAGLAQLTAWLCAAGARTPPHVKVAIERPDGPVVEILLAAGFPVYALNPKQLDRFRDRHTVAGAKDDRRDAMVLADSLRTDLRAFRQVLLTHPQLIELSELVRIEEDLRREENGLINRFREQLGRYAPGLLDLMAHRADPFFWSLIIGTIQSPQHDSLSLDEIRALLREHRIRRITAEQVHESTCATRLPVSQGTLAAVAMHLTLLVPRLRLVHSHRRQCQKQLQKLLQELMAVPPGEALTWQRDAAILASLPGVGRLTLATLLSEAHEPIGNRDLHTLRCWGGVAPVTRQSGKSHFVCMRRACNPRLRFAYYHWGRVALIHDSHTKQHYARLRAKGHSHGRALRGVVDRLLTVAVAMLRNGVPYQADHRCQPNQAA
jgi:transposase